MNVTLVNNGKRDWNISKKREEDRREAGMRMRERDRERNLYSVLKIFPQEQKENHMVIPISIYDETYLYIHYAYAHDEFNNENYYRARVIIRPLENEDAQTNFL